MAASSRAARSSGSGITRSRCVLSWSGRMVSVLAAGSSWSDRTWHRSFSRHPDTAFTSTNSRGSSHPGKAASSQRKNAATSSSDGTTGTRLGTLGRGMSAHGLAVARPRSFRCPHSPHSRRRAFSTVFAARGYSFAPGRLDRRNGVVAYSRRNRRATSAVTSPGPAVGTVARRTLIVDVYTSRLRGRRVVWAVSSATAHSQVTGAGGGVAGVGGGDDAGRLGGGVGAGAAAGRYLAVPAGSGNTTRNRLPRRLSE
ncbi:MAG: hypothetical protein ABGY75_15325 [Gemmataceae bacterium]